MARARLTHTVKVLDQSRLAPPSGSVEETSLPLTFFDVLWVPIQPVRRVFFFEFSGSKTHFLTTHLPNIKRSLSFALQLFYPLSGTLALSPQTGEHEIRYTNGDSVPLTVAESDSDFHGLVADHPKDTAAFHPLAPDLPASDLISIQVTVFADSGVSVGLTVHHAAGDGSSVMHFMRLWASICRLGPESSSNSLPRPLYDRTLVKDPNGLKRIFSDQLSVAKREQLTVGAKAQRGHMVRATFVMSRADIEELRQRVNTARGEKRPLHLSSFVLTCAHVWVCLAKAQRNETSIVHFMFAVDCRSRLDPPIPDTYFGNCIGACMGSVRRCDITRGDDDGLVAACEAFGGGIQRLNDDNDGGGGVLKEADQWIPRALSIVAQGDRFFSVAGSPRIRVYDMDFGFGRPCKVEVISIEETGAISLAESRDGRGIEVGLALPDCEMERFATLYKEGLKDH